MKLAKSIFVISSVLFLSILVTNSYFTDRVTSQGNQFSAGTWESETDKVRICHRSNAYANPYQSIEVAYSAIDGDGQNDHSLHLGPVFDPITMEQGDTWGDIISPVPGITSGLNWPEGQIIWENNCVAPPVSVS